MDQQLVTLSSFPLHPETGLNIIGEVYTTNSTLTKVVGLREFGNLIIGEVIAFSSTITFINRIVLLNSDLKIILSIEFGYGTQYTRELVQQSVCENLTENLIATKTEKGEIEPDESIRLKVKKQVYEVYFGQSNAAALKWAAKSGISIFPSLSGENKSELIDTDNIFNKLIEIS